MMASRALGRWRALLVASCLAAVPLAAADAVTVTVSPAAPSVEPTFAAQARYKVDHTNWDQAIVSSPSPFDLAASANIGNAGFLNGRTFDFTLSYTKNVGYTWTLDDGVARTVAWTAPDGAISQLRKVNTLHLYAVAQTQVPRSGTSSAQILVSGLAFSGATVVGDLDDLAASSTDGSFGEAGYWLRSDTPLSNTDWSLTGQVKAMFACASGPTCFSTERLKLEVKAAHVTPIPAAAWLLGTAVAGLGWAARRRRRR
jgi:hypothetical protein